MPDLASVRALMARDRFAASCGVRLVALSEGHARTRMTIRPDHLNGVGVVQGGAIFTLADLAFAAACNSSGTVAVALDVSITFARPGLTGRLEAEARQVALSRRVSVCEVTVRDRKGEIVALFRGTAFRKEEPVASLLPARPARGTATAARQGGEGPRRPGEGPAGRGRPEPPARRRRRGHPSRRR